MNDRSIDSSLEYLSGFGSHHESEAVAGALPVGRNSPQKTPFGLYAEQLSGSSFTMPRAQNLRSWLYRLRPSASHKPYRRISDGMLRTAPSHEGECSPNRLRWSPLPAPTEAADFLAGMATFVTCGDARLQHGCAAHVYVANRSMEERRFCYDADGELLVVPQQGAIVFATELGRLRVEPGEIAVIPRGIKFRAEIESELARGYVCENYGAPLRLPELGPIGSNGLANPRDFLAPTAAYEDRDAPTEVIAKFAGHLWSAQYDHSPLDVVAWHGNYYPYKYDLARFNAMNTVSYDHPDPSIFTVLTSPSETPGAANVDFVIFPPRWVVAIDTFRPPYFHRNVMSEFMGLVRGEYDAKQGGFVPGAASLHSSMSGHGPDRASYESAVAAKLEPRYLDKTLAFMFESRYLMEPTAFAQSSPALDADYDAVWDGFDKASLSPGEGVMKLASLKGPTRDGTLCVVDREMKRAVKVEGIAPTMQYALEHWDAVEPKLRDAAASLAGGHERHSFDFEAALAEGKVAAPLPRAYEWLDGSAYLTHVERVRRARNDKVPESFYTDPLMYQGGAGSMMGARDPIRALSEEWGIDLEGEVVAIVGDVPMGAKPAEAAKRVRLLSLVNDVSFRRLIPAELAKGFGFVNGKGANALAPVAVTPDELGDLWRDGKVHLPLRCDVNGQRLGDPNAGVDATFSLFDLIAHAAKTRDLAAGTMIGTGTISNQDRNTGYACLMEARLVEQVEVGEAKTPFLKFGDRVRIEMRDAKGASVFGAIDHRVEKHDG